MMDEALRHAATVTAGQVEVEPDKLFDPGDEKIEYTRDLWPWVLLFVACGLVLDTYLKRVRFFGHKALPYR